MTPRAEEARRRVRETTEDLNVSELTCKLEDARFQITSQAERANTAEKEVQRLTEVLADYKFDAHADGDISRGLERQNKDYEIIVQNLKARISELEVKRKKCSWTFDEFHDAWDTSCGNKFCFIEGGPLENGAEFCQYCGGILSITKNLRKEK